MRFTKNGVLPSDDDRPLPLPLPPEPAPPPAPPVRRWRWVGLLGPSSYRTPFQCLWMAGVWLLCALGVWHYLPLLTGWQWGDWDSGAVPRHWKFASILWLLAGVVGAASHLFWLGVALLRRLGVVA